MRVWMLLATLPAWAQTGGELFEKNCAGCHKAGSPTRAPLPESLRKLSRQAILETLTTGKMIAQAASLSMTERSSIAVYLAKDQNVEVSGGKCESAAGPLQDVRGWQGWSPDITNSRFQSGAGAGVDADKVKGLKLKWAFGYPGALTAYGQPSVAGGRLFAGSADGTVFALDPKTGCTY
jgi:polyvinyl alcohol dehydrogenase (cytochrome)